MYSVSIKGVLFTSEAQVVLLLNERDEWELPGGRIELGESSPGCLTREIKEELSVHADIGPLLDTFLFEVIPNRHVFIVTYRCTVSGHFAPQVSDEHKRIGCFAVTDLPERLPAGYHNSIALAVAASAGEHRHA
jgi:8-oxo-dGTP pyrophosphatase MutT (NUDIX family)